MAADRDFLCIETLLDILFSRFSFICLNTVEARISEICPKKQVKPSPTWYAGHNLYFKADYLKIADCGDILYQTKEIQETIIVVNATFSIVPP